MATNTSRKSSNRLIRPGSGRITQGTKVAIGPSKASDSQIKCDGAKASVNLNRGANGIESIEVTCACGEKILIRCDYDN